MLKKLCLKLIICYLLETEFYSKRKQAKGYAKTCTKFVHLEVEKPRSDTSFQWLACKQYKCKSAEDYWRHLNKTNLLKSTELSKDFLKDFKLKTALSGHGGGITQLIKN